MSATAIMSAMMASLSSFASTNGISVAYENALFTPTGTSPYLRAHMIPSATKASGLGTAAQNFHYGTFQVDTSYEANKGYGAAQDMSEKVRKHFKRGKKLMSDCLVVDSSYIAVGIVSEGRYIIPVRVNYWAWVSND